MRAPVIQPKFGPAVVGFIDEISQVLGSAIGKPFARIGAEDPAMRTFLERVTKHAAQMNGNSRNVPTGRAVTTWRDGKVPQDPYFQCILNYVFKDSPADDPARKRLVERWEAARDERDAGSRARREANRSVPQNDPDPTITDFEATHLDPLWDGVAELRLVPPPRGGNDPNVVPVRATLVFGKAEVLLEDYGATLALTSAMLVPQYVGSCEASYETRAGEPLNPSDHLIAGAVTWTVAGPKPDNAPHLNGRPLGPSQPLLDLRLSGSEEDGITVTLRSKKRALDVIPDDDTDPNRIAKDKVLKALMQKITDRGDTPDPDGWIVWGRSRLRRKKPTP